MEQWIASVDLVAVHPDGSRRPLTLRVAVPAPNADGIWACRAELVGLYDGLAPMGGEDALQALCLALGLVATLLRDFRAGGGRVEYPGGGEFPLEAYFGTFGTFTPAA